MSTTVGTTKLPALAGVFFNMERNYLNRAYTITLLLKFVCLLVHGMVSPMVPLYFINAITMVVLVTNGNDLAFATCRLLSNNLLLNTMFVTASCDASPVDTGKGVVFTIKYKVMASLVEVFKGLPRNISFSVVLVGVLIPRVRRLATPGPFKALGRGGRGGRTTT